MIIRRSSLSSVDFGGLKILDYTQGRDSLSSIAQVAVPQGGKHPQAWSRGSDKYYVVISGSVRFTIDGEGSDLNTGDCCVIPKGHHFSYENITKRSAKLLLIHTPPFRLDDEVFVECTHYDTSSTH